MLYDYLADARTARDMLNKGIKRGRYYITTEANSTYSIRFTYLKRAQCMEIK